MDDSDVHVFKNKIKSNPERTCGIQSSPHVCGTLGPGVCPGSAMSPGLSKPVEFIFHKHLEILKLSTGQCWTEELHIKSNQTDYSSSEPNWQNPTAFMVY